VNGTSEGVGIIKGHAGARNKIQSGTSRDNSADGNNKGSPRVHPNYRDRDGRHK